MAGNIEGFGGYTPMQAYVNRETGAYVWLNRDEAEVERRAIDKENAELDVFGFGLNARDPKDDDERQRFESAERLRGEELSQRNQALRRRSNARVPATVYETLEGDRAVPNEEIPTFLEEAKAKGYEPKAVNGWKSKGFIDADGKPQGLGFFFAGTQDDSVINSILRYGKERTGGYLTPSQLRFLGYGSGDAIEQAASDSERRSRRVANDLFSLGKMGTAEREGHAIGYGGQRLCEQNRGTGAFGRTVNYFNTRLNPLGDFLAERGQALEDRYGGEDGLERLRAEGGLSGWNRLALGVPGAELDIGQQYEVLRERKLEREKANYEEGVRGSTFTAKAIGATADSARMGIEFGLVNTAMPGAGLGAKGATLGKQLLRGAAGTVTEMALHGDANRQKNLADQMRYDPVTGGLQVSRKGMGVVEAALKGYGAAGLEYVGEMYSMPLVWKPLGKLGKKLGGKLLPSTVKKFVSKAAERAAGSGAMRLMDEIAANPTIDALRRVQQRTGLNLTFGGLVEESLGEELPANMLSAGLNLDNTSEHDGGWLDAFGAAKDTLAAAPSLAVSVVLMGAGTGLAVRGASGAYNFAMSTRRAKEALRELGVKEADISGKSKDELNDLLFSTLSKRTFANTTVYDSEQIAAASSSELDKALHENGLLLDGDDGDGIPVEQKREALLNYYKSMGGNALTQRAVGKINRSMVNMFGRQLNHGDIVERLDADVFKKNLTAFTADEREAMREVMTFRSMAGSSQYAGNMMGEYLSFQAQQLEDALDEAQRSTLAEYERRFSKDATSGGLPFPMRETLTANVSSQRYAQSSFRQPMSPADWGNNNGDGYVDFGTGITIRPMASESGKARYRVDADGVRTVDEAREDEASRELRKLGVEPRRVGLPMGVQTIFDSLEEAREFASRLSAWQNTIQRNVLDKARAARLIYGRVRGEDAVRREGIVLAHSPMDVPSAVRDEIVDALERDHGRLDERELSRRFSSVRGLTSGVDGRVYVFLDNNTSPYELLNTVQHEGLHQGLFDAFMADSETRQAALAELSKNPKVPAWLRAVDAGNPVAVEEALARVAETVDTVQGLFSQVSNAFKRGSSNGNRAGVAMNDGDVHRILFGAFKARRLDVMEPLSSSGSSARVRVVSEEDVRTAATPKIAPVVAPSAVAPAPVEEAKGAPMETKVPMSRGASMPAAEEAMLNSRTAVAKENHDVLDDDEGAGSTSDAGKRTVVDMLQDSDAKEKNVPVSEILVNDRIPQFKRGADPKTGVVPESRLSGEYAPTVSHPIRVLEFEDGRREVITGRHRLDLARRTGMKTIPAIVYRETDGMTVEKATALDAAENIMDGKGSVRDYVRFFADTGMRREEFERLGISNSENPNVRNAYAVATDGIDEVRVHALDFGSKLPVGVLGAIARSAPKGERNGARVQLALLDDAVKNGTRDVTAIMLMGKRLKLGLDGAEKASSTQGDLFGSDDAAIELSKTVALGQAAFIKEVKNLRNDMASAVTHHKGVELRLSVAKQYGITDKDDRGQIERAIGRLDREIAMWDTPTLGNVKYGQALVRGREIMGKRTGEMMPTPLDSGNTEAVKADASKKSESGSLGEVKTEFFSNKPDGTTTEVSSGRRSADATLKVTAKPTHVEPAEVRRERANPQKEGTRSPSAEELKALDEFKDVLQQAGLLREGGNNNPSQKIRSRKTSHRDASPQPWAGTIPSLDLDSEWMVANPLERVQEKASLLKKIRASLVAPALNGGRVRVDGGNVVVTIASSIGLKKGSHSSWYGSFNPAESLESTKTLRMSDHPMNAANVALKDSESFVSLVVSHSHGVHTKQLGDSSENITEYRYNKKQLNDARIRSFVSDISELLCTGMFPNTSKGNVVAPRRTGQLREGPIGLTDEQRTNVMRAAILFVGFSAKQVENANFESVAKYIHGLLLSDAEGRKTWDATKRFLRSAWTQYSDENGLEEVSRGDAQRVFVTIERGGDTIGEKEQAYGDEQLRVQSEVGSEGDSVGGRDVSGEEPNSRGVGFGIEGRAPDGGVSNHSSGLATEQPAKTDSHDSGGSGGRVSASDSGGKADAGTGVSVLDVGGNRGVRSGSDAVPVAHRRGGADRSAKKSKGVSAKSAASVVAGQNYVIPEDGGGIGQGTSVRDRVSSNLTALMTLQEFERGIRPETEEARRCLSLYSGWGGLSAFFDEGRTEYSSARNALRHRVSESEYKAAQRSVQYAHYTPIPVVRAMWDALEWLGVKGDGLRAFEGGVGVGHFIGAMPASLRGTHYRGVEVDPLTARIAKRLYPRAEIFERGFQDTALAEGGLDFAIGNPPFSTLNLFDATFPEGKGMSMHNYFIAKQIKALRPGGVAAFVVSRYFLDAKDSKTREYIDTQAEFLGALRLPGDTFSDIAGTDVVTDLVFFRKRFSLEAKVMGVAPVWLESAPFEMDELSAPVNRWILEHSGANRDSVSVMGKLRLVKGTQYDKNGASVEVVDESGKSKTREGIFARLKSILALAANIWKAVPAENGAMVAQECGTGHAVSLSETGRQNVSGELHPSLMPGGYFVASDGMLSVLVKAGEGLDTTTAEVLLVEDYDAVSETAAHDARERANPTGRADKGSVKKARVFSRWRDVPNASAKLTKAEQRLARALAELRNVRYDLVALELSTDASDTAIEAKRKALNGAYERFLKVSDGKPLSDSLVRNVLDNDPAASQVLGLEIETRDERNRLTGIEKSKIFTERVNFPKFAPAAHYERTVDALAASLSMCGFPDIDWISSVTGKSAYEVLGELSGKVFVDPISKKAVLAEEYLSGDVKMKLEEAEKAVEDGYEEAKANVEALKKVIPEDISVADISLPFGSYIIPSRVVSSFGKEVLGLQFEEDLSAWHNDTLGSWEVQLNGEAPARTQAKYPTAGVAGGFGAVIKAALNNVTLRVSHKLQDGTTISDEGATELVNATVRSIRDAWEGWWRVNGERARELGKIYNETFNRNVDAVYDGSALTFNGLNPKLVPYKHQRDAAWRAIVTRNTLLNHVVGSGKTNTSVLAVMEMKRMGIVNKPMFVVPNHLIGQWRKEFLAAYPGADILAAGKEDFTPENRRRLFGRIQNGRFDAVIVPHSQIGNIMIHPDTLKTLMNEEIDRYRAALDAMRNGKNAEKRSISRVEKMVQSLEERMKSRIAAIKKDNIGIFLDTLGVDGFFLDEAHEFKNVPFVSGLRVAGMGTPAGSLKAFDLMMKLKYFRRFKENAPIVFMTGTPVSNSLTELYLNMMYMAPDTLEQAGIYSMDAFLSAFGNVSSEYEIDTTGRFNETTRLRSIVNVGELMGIIRTYMDVVDSKGLRASMEAVGKQYTVPEMEGGKPENVVAKRSPEQMAYFGEVVSRERLPNGGFRENFTTDSLSYRADHMKGMNTRVDNMLKVTGDARAAALDIRLRVPNAPDFAGSKLNLCVERVASIWKETESDHGVQLVFCDTSIPKSASEKIRKELEKKRAEYERARKGLEALEESGADISSLETESEKESLPEKVERLEHEIVDMEGALTSGFSVYDDIRQKLLARGVPEGEIAFIHDYDTDLKKSRLFDAVNTGCVRVLLGSTPKMGAGMNAQRRLVALHHLDTPWRPSDMEQRNGRILRQGNELFDKDPDNFRVRILQYATEQTADAYKYQTLESKGKAFHGIWTADRSMRMVEDVSDQALSAEEMKSLASGSRLVLLRVDMKKNVEELDRKSRNYYGTRVNIEDGMSTAQVEADKVADQLKRAREIESLMQEREIDKDNVYAGVELLDAKTGKQTETLSARTFTERANAKEQQSIANLMLKHGDVLRYRGLVWKIHQVQTNKNDSLFSAAKLSGYTGLNSEQILLNTTSFDISEIRDDLLFGRINNVLSKIPANIMALEKRIVEEKESAATYEEQFKKMPEEFPQAQELLDARREQKDLDDAVFAGCRTEQDAKEFLNTKYQGKDVPAYPWANPDADTSATDGGMLREAAMIGSGNIIGERDDSKNGDIVKRIHAIKPVNFTKDSGKNADIETALKRWMDNNGSGKRELTDAILKTVPDNERVVELQSGKTFVLSRSGIKSVLSHMKPNNKVLMRARTDFIRNINAFIQHAVPFYQEEKDGQTYTSYVAPVTYNGELYYGTMTTKGLDDAEMLWDVNAMRFNKKPQAVMPKAFGLGGPSSFAKDTERYDYSPSREGTKSLNPLTTKSVLQWILENQDKKASDFVFEFHGAFPMLREAAMVGSGHIMEEKDDGKNSDIVKRIHAIKPVNFTKGFGRNDGIEIALKKWMDNQQHAAKRELAEAIFRSVPGNKQTIVLHGGKTLKLDKNGFENALSHIGMKNKPLMRARTDFLTNIHTFSKEAIPFYQEEKNGKTYTSYVAPSVYNGAKYYGLMTTKEIDGVDFIWDVNALQTNKKPQAVMPKASRTGLTSTVAKDAEPYDDSPSQEGTKSLNPLTIKSVLQWILENQDKNASDFVFEFPSTFSVLREGENKSAAYLKAAERGDMDSAQGKVDEGKKKNRSEKQIRGRNLYHTDASPQPWAGTIPSAHQNDDRAIVANGIKWVDAKVEELEKILQTSPLLAPAMKGGRVKLDGGNVVATIAYTLGFVRYSHSSWYGRFSPVESNDTMQTLRMSDHPVNVSNVALSDNGSFVSIIVQPRYTDKTPLGKRATDIVEYRYNKRLMDEDRMRAFIGDIAELLRTGVFPNTSQGNLLKADGETAAMLREVVDVDMAAVDAAVERLREAMPKSLLERTAELVKAGLFPKDGETRHAFMKRKTKAAAAWMSETFVDSRTPMISAVKSIVGDKPLAENEDIALAMQTSYGRVFAEHLDIDHIYVKPTLAELAKSGLGIAELDVYLTAMFAPERNQMIQERAEWKTAGSGISNEEASKRLRGLAKKLSSEQMRTLETCAQTVYAMNRKTLERLADFGVLSTHQVEEWMRMSPHYVPLRDDLERVATMETEGESMMNPFKRAVGRYSETSESSLAWSILQAKQGVIWAEQNYINNVALMFCKKHPSEQDYCVLAVPLRAEKVFRERKGFRAEDAIPLRSDVPTEATAIEAYRHGGYTLMPDVKNPAVFWVDVKELDSVLRVKKAADRIKTAQRQNVVAKVSGHRVYVLFNNEKGTPGNKMGMAITRANMVHWDNAMWRGITSLTRLKALMTTTLSPTFAIRNMVSDALQTIGIMTTELRFKALGDVLRNYAPALKTFSDWKLKGAFNDQTELGAYLKEAVNNGLLTGIYANSTYESNLSESVLKPLNKLRHAEKFGKTTVDTIAYSYEQFRDIMQGVAEVPEVGIRLAVYSAMRKHGMSVNDATVYAREITVDFNKKGTVTPVTNVLYMFSNAGVQSLARWKTAAEVGGWKGVALGAFAFVALGFFSALYNANVYGALFGGDDDDDKDAWRNIPDYARQGGIPILLPGGIYADIPTRGIHSAFIFMGQKLYDVLVGEDDPGSVLYDIVTGPIAENINFVNGTGSLAQGLAPTVVDPIVQLLENKSWTGAPLHAKDYGNSFTPHAYMGRERTSPVAKWIAGFLNRISGGDDVVAGKMDVYPESIALVAQFFGSAVGTDIGRLTNLASGDVSVANVPVLRGVLKPLPGNMARYFDAKVDFSHALHAMQKYALTSRQKSLELLEDKPYLRNAAGLKRLGTTIDRITQQRNAMVAKGLEIKEVDLLLEDLRRRFLELYNAGKMEK